MSTLSPDNATVVQPSPFETLQDLQSLVETRDTTYNNPNDIGDGRQTGSEPEGPRHHALLPPDFLWGEKTGEVFSQLVFSAYEEVVHWRHNIFLIPSGRAGKTFVRELARLYQAYADASTLECIALKAGTVLQCLLLQKPHAKSKSKDHSTHLERRLKLWLDGDISTLLREGRCIQRHLPSPTNQEDNLEKNARVFSRLMLQGKVNAALRFISKDTNRGILSLDSLIPTGKDLNGEITWQTAIDVLREKHPKGKVAPAETLLSESESHTAEFYHDPIVFEQITGEAIRQAALHTHGAAGPSGVDAYAWRRFCSSFKSASTDICNALAAVARRLCTTDVHPDGLTAFVACRLIPLNKNPGVRPIGIGEVPRRIMAKAILRTIGDDVQSAAGPLQACAGHEAGCEAAVHTMKEIYSHDDTEAILLVDATNAFNVINRQAALHNIQVLCPSISTVLNNTYRAPVRLFVMGEGEIESTEGTTQGDPLAMAMYALAATPLIRRLKEMKSDVKQVWFADDATAAGKLRALLQWWQHLTVIGPSFGYYPNASKTHLVVKPDLMDEAAEIFHSTKVQITSKGQRHLGAAIGTPSFAEEYVALKVEKWSAEISALSSLAHSQPHVAYAAFVHGIAAKWKYVMRTINNTSQLFQPLETVIHQQLIPALTGREPCSPEERVLFSLPARHGGLNILNPMAIAE